MRLDKILVPTDFSDTAEHAVTQAVELALGHDSELHLFHVVEPYGEPPRNMMAVVREYLEELEKTADEALASRAEAIRARDIEVQCSAVHHVAPFEAIQDEIEAMGPDLVVMGTHGRRGFQRLILGSVAEKLLRSVRVHMLTLSLEAPLVTTPPSYSRILVPVDFSDFSKRTLDAAFSLVAENGTVDILHVVHTPIYPTFYPGPMAVPVATDPKLTESIRDHLDQWRGDRNAEIHVREGDAFHEILETCDETGAELIAMGTRGLTGLDYVLLGSVTEKVVRRSKVAVLTVH